MGEGRLRCWLVAVNVKVWMKVPLGLTTTLLAEYTSVRSTSGTSWLARW